MYVCTYILYYLILSYFILSYFILSYFILSNLILFYLILSCLILKNVHILIDDWFDIADELGVLAMPVSK